MDIISKRPLHIKAFELFGSAHLLTVLLLFVLGFIALHYAKKSEKFSKFFKYYLWISLLILDVVYRLWGAFYQTHDLTILFSLHLSSMAVILAIILLNKFNQLLFDVLFYWGLLAVPQAIITPGIIRYGFPHLRFFHILLIHVTVVIAVVYLITIEGRKPSKQSLKRSLLITHIYGGFVFVVNIIMGTNFMFIGRVSQANTIINVLGPWPYYIIYLDLILITLFTGLYLFYFKLLNNNKTLE